MKPEQSASIFGYFERPDQTVPSFDPGLDALCPFCLMKLEKPVRTISLMLPGDKRSFFYRTHRACAEKATAQEVTDLESALIDSRAHSATGDRG